MEIEENTVVKINYSLHLQTGELPERLRQSFTSKFIYGKDRILPALEKAFAGHKEGDELEVSVPPEQTYGPHDPGLVNEISIADIRHPEKLRVGSYYEETGPDGRTVGFSVNKIRGDSVLADFNHPAAGKDIILKVKITEVRPASFMDLVASMNLSVPRGKG